VGIVDQPMEKKEKTLIQKEVQREGKYGILREGIDNRQIFNPGKSFFSEKEKDSRERGKVNHSID